MNILPTGLVLQDKESDNQYIIKQVTELDKGRAFYYCLGKNNGYYHTLTIEEIERRFTYSELECASIRLKQIVDRL